MGRLQWGWGHPIVFIMVTTSHSRPMNDHATIATSNKIHS
jgi:hypothetical protein